jgi:hypothetical protein
VTGDIPAREVANGDTYCGGRLEPDDDRFQGTIIDDLRLFLKAPKFVLGIR